MLVVRLVAQVAARVRDRGRPQERLEQFEMGFHPSSRWQGQYYLAVDSVLFQGTPAGQQRAEFFEFHSSVVSIPAGSA